MKTRNIPCRPMLRRLPLPAFCAAIALVCGQVQAQTILNINTTNVSNDLSANASWVGGTAPGAANIASFQNASDTSYTIGTSPLSVSGVLVNSAAGRVQISGAGSPTLSVGANGINVQTANFLANAGSTVNVSADQTWNASASRNITIEGALSGTSRITKNGQGSLTLSSGVDSSGFSGNWTIANGVINLAHNTGLGTGTGAVAINAAGSSIYLIGTTGQTVDRDIVLGGTTAGSSAGGAIRINGPQTATWAGDVKVNSDNALVGGSYAARTLNFTGDITTDNNSKAIFRAEGGSSINLTGNVLNLGNGTLTFQSATAGSTTQNLLIENAGGTTLGGIVFNTSSSNRQVITLGSAVTLGSDHTIVSAGELRIGNGGTAGSISPSRAITNHGTLTINRSNAVVQGTDFSSAAITGSGSFVQAGVGTTTLNTNNTYSGGTTISAGTLLVNNVSGSGTGSGLVTVESGAALGGSGIISGSVSFALDSKFSWDGLSTLTVNGGSVTFGGFDGSDLLVSNWGVVTNGFHTLIGGSTDVNFTNVNTSWFATGDARQARFVEGSLRLEVIPEPSIAALLVGSLAALTLLRRRRTSRS